MVLLKRISLRLKNTFNFKKKGQKGKNELKQPMVPEGLIFTPYFKKKVNPKYIDAFWKDYFSGIIEKRTFNRFLNSKLNYIGSYNSSLILFRITPTVVGTVRKFSIKDFPKYKMLYSRLKKDFSEIKLKKSEVVLVDVLSIQKDGRYFYVLERVFPSISVLNFEFFLKHTFSTNLNKENRFFRSFLKTFRESGLSQKSFHTKLKKAFFEFKKHKKIKRYGNSIDIAENNLIILGYDKKKDKFRFGFIDFGFFHSGSF